MSAGTSRNLRAAFCKDFLNRSSAIDKIFATRRAVPAATESGTARMPVSGPAVREGDPLNPVRPNRIGPPPRE